MISILLKNPVVCCLSVAWHQDMPFQGGGGDWSENNENVKLSAMKLDLLKQLDQL